jgi:hypothetical protein
MCGILKNRVVAISDLEKIVPLGEVGGFEVEGDGMRDLMLWMAVA